MLCMSMPLARPASGEDLECIAALLRANDLPTADLAQSRPEFFVIEQGSALIGVGALERFGAVALLRSMAVAKEHRRLGVASSLLARLEEHAAAHGVHELVLLTQTAEAFFARHGYRKVERSAVPGSVQATSEFASLCPVSAACMMKRLDSSTARSYR